MTADNWERLKDLFERALACGPPEEQREFLAANCGGDAALCAELESLLEEHGRMSAAFLEQAPVSELRARATWPAEGSVIGAYRLERQLGRGGMGTVFLASRADGAYQKQVAIKLLSAGGTNEELVRRFLAERQILARLDHPNIARLVDGGATEQGQPYLVMDYVEGIPIDRYCRERALKLEQRLELFEQVCAAIAYAHENLVVHRDVKPGNILVTAEGTPKLLDFGIAKLLHPETGDSESRRTLLVFGTPEYSSPEQVRGRAITKATDVYSLGVLLYELLTDRSPYQVASRAADEMVRVICEEDPEPPSSAISRSPTRQEEGETEPASGEDHKRRRRLSGDLDNIVMMALRKEPEQRYQTAAELAKDLRRHVEGLPVHARGRSWGYRTAKFVRRRRTAIGASAMVAVAAIAVLVTVEAGRQSHTEPANRQRWDRGADSVSPDGRLLSFTDTRVANDLTLHDLMTGTDRRLTKNADKASPFIASSVFSRDGLWLAYTVLQGKGSPTMELHIIARNGSGQRTLFRDTGSNWLLAHDWSDKQHVLLSIDQGGPTKLLLVSTQDGSSRQMAVSAGWWGGNRVMVSPDGRYAAYTAKRQASQDSEIRILSLVTGADAAFLAQPADDSVLGWSPDGSRLVFSSNRSGLGGHDIWWAPMANGQAAGAPQRFGPTPDLFKSLGVTKDGSLFYAASNDSDEVFLSDVDPVSGRLSAPRVLSGRFAGTKTAPAWSPDGATALFVAGDTLHFHNVSSGNERDMQTKVTSLRRVAGWRADGRTLYEYANGPDGKAGLFSIDTQNGEARKMVDGNVKDAALSPDGNTLYKQGGPESRSIVSRNLSSGEERVLYTRPRPQDLLNLRLSLSPDGRMLAMQLWDVPAGFESLAVMPVSGGEARVLLQIHQPGMFGAGAITWSADSRYVYAAPSSGLFNFGLGYNDQSEILRVPLDGGPTVAAGAAIEGTVRHLTLSRDGRQALYQTHRSTGETWSLENFLPPRVTRR